MNPYLAGGIFSQREDNTDDTTADGMQVFWVAFADSNYDGRGPSDITIGSGILYLWNGTSLTEITSQNIANGGTYGTPWKQFAVDYVAANPGKKVVLVNSARGGSRLYPGGSDNYDWYTTGGIMRAQAAAQVDACLNYLGLTKVKGTFGNACINDVRNGTSISNISLALDSAVTYVTGKFPGVPFLYCTPGHDETDPNGFLLRQTRDLIQQKKRTVTEFCCPATCAYFYSLGYGTLHFNTQDAYNQLGASVARWFSNSGTSNKHARDIISQHWGTLTSTRKGLIETEIAAYGTWLFDDIEYYFPLKISDTRDLYIDYCGLQAPFADNITFTADSHIATTGNSNSLYRTFFNPSTLQIRASQNDQFHALWLKQAYSDASTIRSAFGASNAAGQFTVGHTTSGTYYRANDNTLTVYATDAVLQNETLYTARRQGTTKALVKNATQVSSATVSSATNVNQNIIIGGRNNGGTNTNPMQLDARAIIGGKDTNINYTTLYNAMNARISGW